MKLFQGDNWVDHIAYGEGLYGPAGDSMVAPKGTQPQEAFEQWGRIAREVARAGMPLHSHTTLDHTFNGFLDQIEKINGSSPSGTCAGRSSTMSRPAPRIWNG